MPTQIYILKYITMQKQVFYILIIHNIAVYLYQINAALVSIILIINNILFLVQKVTLHNAMIQLSNFLTILRQKSGIE